MTTNSPARAHFLAHIASEIVLIDNNVSTFFSGGVFKGFWNPNTSPNQLPTLSSTNDIYIVSQNSSYHGEVLMQGQLVKVIQPPALLLYEKILPVEFFISVVNSLLENISTEPSEGGSGGSYLGELSLTPTYSYDDAQANYFLGCTGNVNLDGSLTITPNNPLILVPNLNNGTGFITTIKNIAIPQEDNYEMSFVWPDLSLDIEGGTAFYIVIYNSSVSDEDLVAGFQSSPSVEIFSTILAVEMYNGDTQNVYSFNKISRGDPVNYKDFTLPTAGDKLYLLAYPDGNFAIGSDTVAYQYLANYPLRYLPEGENLSIAFMYATGKEVTSLTSFELDLTAREGNSSFQQITNTTPAEIPEDAKDGDLFLCTGTGKIGETLVHNSDGLILTNNKTDCIVLLSENTIRNLVNKTADAAIEGFSSRIGLGMYSQSYNIQSGANAEISAQLLTGGIIDNAIKAATSP